MDLRNFNGFELRNFYFTTVQKPFQKLFIRNEKLNHVELNSGTSKSSIIKSSKKLLYTFEDIELQESHAKLHKNRLKLWEQIELKG